MLADRDAVATVAVKDLAAAKRFYEGVLGLKQVSAEGQEAVTYATGASTLIVYRSAFAGTNQATAVNWRVGDDIDRIARELRAKGVTFEHYDMPQLTLDGDVHVAGEMRVAWFKDPDRNIHSLMNR
jgi:catechol 2,3-dioxygenase-like lactoylglutathione lyase family enzyme